MRLRVDGIHRVGQALDLRGTSIDPAALVDSIRDPTDARVVCQPPGEVHRHVGWIRPGMDVDLREALLAAARSLGYEPPQAADIARLDREIEAYSPPQTDLATARARAAAAGESVAEHRERVARLSGRLEAAREAGADTEEAAALLQEATAALSEAETEALAARQALDRAERQARRARDEREKRLSLVDRRENLRRRARAWLLEEIRPRFERALASLPGGPVLSDSVRRPDVSADRTMDIPPHRAALAVARIARIGAPLVIGAKTFDVPVRARAACSAPVILV